MKFFSKTIMLMLTFAGIFLTSCGGSDYKEIDKKIEHEGVFASFTENEYRAMLDSCEKTFAKLNSIYESSSDQRMEEIDAEFEKNMQSFIYFSALSLAAEDGKLNEPYLKRFNTLNKRFKSLSEQIKQNCYYNSQCDEFEDENTLQAPIKSPIKISSPNAFQGYQHEFTGKIGTSSRINMKLDLENYTGYCYYLDDSSKSYPKLQIISYDPEERTIQILETNESGGTTGIFQGYLSETGELYGSYTNENGEESTFYVEVNDAP